MTKKPPIPLTLSPPKPSILPPWVGFVVFAGFLRLALEFVYHNAISVLFGYEGYAEGFARQPYIESWIAFFILLIIVPKQLNRPSDFFVTYLVFLTALPFTILYPAMQAPSWNLWFFIATVFVICVFRLTKPFAILRINNGRKIFLFIALPIIFMVTIQLIINNGLDNFNFNIMLVYEIRSNINTLGESILMNYMTVWMTKVFGPIILAILLLNRRYALAIMAVLLHVVWFGTTQHKSVLFYPLLVFVSFRFLKGGGSLSFLPISLLAVTMISYLVYHFSGDINMVSFLVRRSLFTPALFTFDYYAFFAQNEFVYWSNSIMSPFIPYPYMETVPTLISQMRGGEGGANNHFLAAGYMQAGVFGLFLYAVITIVILNIFDSFQAEGLPTWFVVAVGVVPMHALLTSADLPVALITHGLAICLVSLMFVCSPDTKDKEIR